MPDEIGYTDPVVRWTFTELSGKAEPPTYTFHINPNEGGSPTIDKAFAVNTNAGPNRGVIVQEGQSGVPTLSFSGVILTQAHFEALEEWFDRRILLLMTDDLGRQFKGIFSTWQPERSRRAFNPWYHTFSATLTVVGYKTASGQVRFGKWGAEV